MAANFSFYHVYGTATGTAGTASAGYGTGNVVNFFGGTSDTDTAVRAAATGTANYNNTGSNIQAGSNSWPIWLKGRFECSTNGTFNNVKFWRYTNSFDTTSMNVVGTIQAAYAEPTSRATGTAQASNVAVPTSSSSTSAPGSPLNLGSVSTSGAGTIYSPSFVTIQLTTGTAQGAGDTAFAGFTLQYDES